MRSQSNLMGTVCSLLAVTMYDLYPDPKWNFVFGTLHLSIFKYCAPNRSMQARRRVDQ